MQAKPLVRDLILLSCAAILGWWAHGANTVVQAQHNSPENGSSSSADNLSFQFGGTQLRDSLTLYSPSNRTLYVYPAASGSSQINCSYSLRIDRPGAPLQRGNCPMGSFLPR